MKSFSFPLLLEYEISFSPIKTLIFLTSMMSFLAPSLDQNKIFDLFQHFPMPFLPCIPMTLGLKKI
jgi:hypothetical protein